MLSVMGSCGMYDWAGEWIYKVGRPAKSGVAGGILAVVPGQIGIGVFSPRLDSHGNSVRGIKVCEALSQRLDLHLFNRRGTRDGAVRLYFNGAKVNSHRVRSTTEIDLLKTHGHRIHVLQLQGNLTFTTTETAVHTALEKVETMDFLILDFGHVLSINDPAARLLYELAVKLIGDARTVIFTHPDRVPLMGRVFRAKKGEAAAEFYRTFADNDPALEFCEDQLLTKEGYVPPVEHTFALSEFELIEGFSDEELAYFDAAVTSRQYVAGDTIILTGEEARERFLLARGRVSVFVGRAGSLRRLATFSPGMIFGEMSLIDRSPRSATIIADSPVECRVLLIDAFDRLGEEHPSVKIKLLENLRVRSEKP